LRAAGDTESVPFSRLERSIVYQRAKGVPDTLSFGALRQPSVACDVADASALCALAGTAGTRQDVHAPGYEWYRHSMAPHHVPASAGRVLFGGPHCAPEHRYSSSLLNVSGMSYGALSDNAITALNTAARLGSFSHNTGEGGVSRFHLAPGGDIVWVRAARVRVCVCSCSQHSALLTGRTPGGGGAEHRQRLLWMPHRGGALPRTSKYARAASAHSTLLTLLRAGAMPSKGAFSAERFVATASPPAVKMIEVKLSQGAKPAHGGILPAAKVTPAIAEARGVALGRDCLSPLRHSAFVGPRGLLLFVQRLRELSGGKPVGIKLCVGQPEEFCALVYAMLELDITPDFITVDGAEGGTGAAPPEFSNSMGTPMEEGLTLVHGVLRGAGLRDRVRLIAAGKILTGFGVVRTLALGADTCNAARAMMFALGCIQALKCNSNACPSGVATQNPELAGACVCACTRFRGLLLRCALTMARLIAAAPQRGWCRRTRHCACIGAATMHALLALACSTDAACSAFVLPRTATTTRCVHAPSLSRCVPAPCTDGTMPPTARTQTVASALELVGAMGLTSPAAVSAEHVMRRVSRTTALSFAELYPPVESGSLLEGSGPPALQRAWDAAGAGMRAHTAPREELLGRAAAATA
jgi:hypothetical protein